MKRPYFAIFIAAVVFMLSGVAWASQAEAPLPHHHKLPVTCTFQKFRSFSDQAWRLTNWENDGPKQAVIDAQRRRLACAPPAHQKAMKALWRKDKKKFYQHRTEELFRVQITPYKCGSTWWATECVIPEHESGYCTGGSNCYGMLDAWYVHGCEEFAPNGFVASKRAQDICAHRHWEMYGRGGWPSY